MSISTSVGHLISEAMSPVDTATIVFYSCFVDIHRLSVHPFDVISVLLIAENGGKTLSAARRRVRPQVKSLFDSLTPVWYRSVLELFGYLLPVKSYSTFSICM
jgi:hypothetical protein